MRKIILLAATLISANAFAQKADVTATQQKAPDNWFNLSFAQDHVHGVGTEQTYKNLIAGRTPDTIIVAVIDGGIDYNHEDLKSVMWHNPGEIPGNGIDDDHNGYVDDVYGWNFIGGKDGKDVQYDNLELVRIYRPLYNKFNGKDPSSIAAADKADYQKYLDLKKKYDAEWAKWNKLYKQMSTFKHIIDALYKDIKKQRNVDTVTYADFQAYQPSQQLSPLYNALKKNVKTEDDFKELNTEVKEGYDEAEAHVDYNLNLDYDCRKIVGDNYDDVNERYYGNNDVKGPEPLHGTHVAGIIAADRFNDLGIKGIASPVKIMAIRAVPDGDERDKDIANAIRYAVDNGAKVINMSFGKPYSPNKPAVDAAVKYAESKGVLLVHAAGNDGQVTTDKDNFPNPDYLSGGTATNWIEVGALSWKTGKYAAASFSNYSKDNVDVFAPGVDIKSCHAGGGYINESGTSMASPVCAGVAAMIRVYFPSLTPEQVKQLILDNSDKSLANTRVILPGEKKKKKKFKKLSRTGGVVDLYAAFQAAEKMK